MIPTASCATRCNVGAVLVLLGYGLIERPLAGWALAIGGWLLAHLMVVFREEPEVAVQPSAPPAGTA